MFIVNFKISKLSLINFLLELSKRMPQYLEVHVAHTQRTTYHNRRNYSNLLGIRRCQWA